MEYDKKIAVVASILGAITIVLGAFGAHTLEQWVAAEALSTFETGVRYQMYHCLGLLMLSWIPGISHKVRNQVFWLFIVGICLFSGSIYLLSLSEVLSINTKVLGPVTPIGGLAFIVGWIRLAVGFYKGN